MKFYVGDKVRLMDGCKVLCTDPEVDFVSDYAGGDAVVTIKKMKKFPDGRIGFAFEDPEILPDPCYYDKRGLELVKRGPNVPKRNKKKPTLKYKVGDKVRTKSGLVDMQVYGGLIYESAMRAEGVISYVDGSGRTYKLHDEPFWYSEEMLELVQEAKEKPTPKFKVGDKVIGNDENLYLITGKGWTGKVVKVRESTIDVVGLNTFSGEGTTFHFLYSDYFDLYTEGSEKAEETKEGKTLEQGELVETLLEVATTNKDIKNLIEKMPLILPTSVIVMELVENKILGRNGNG